MNPERPEASDPSTLCAQGSRALGGDHVDTIVPATAFELADQAAADRWFDGGEGFLYSRLGNPTVRRAERLLAALEGAEDAALFGSGMAAISTLLLTLGGAGRRVAVQREVYGGTAKLVRDVLPAAGVEVLALGLDELAALEPRRLEGCALVHVETPVNPTLRLVDLERVARVAREAGVPVSVDGTFAPPVVQRPLEHGVSLVVHSATKYLGGHGDLTGGVVAGGRELVERVRARRALLGGVLDPFQAFLLVRGVRTLAVRMAAHATGARRVATFLASHPAVERVCYPGLDGHPDRALAERQMRSGGGMLSFVVRGGAAAAERVHDALRLFVRVGTLGGVESLVSIPARMSHRDLTEAERRRSGFDASLVRLSVGLESPADLIDDLRAALDAAADLTSDATA